MQERNKNSAKLLCTNSQFSAKYVMWGEGDRHKNKLAVKNI